MKLIYYSKKYVKTGCSIITRDKSLTVHIPECLVIIDDTIRYDAILEILSNQKIEIIFY